MSETFRCSPGPPAARRVPTTAPASNSPSLPSSAVSPPGPAEPRPQAAISGRRRAMTGTAGGESCARLAGRDPVAPYGAVSGVPDVLEDAAVALDRLGGGEVARL